MNTQAGMFKINHNVSPHLWHAKSDFSPGGADMGENQSGFHGFWWKLALEWLLKQTPDEYFSNNFDGYTHDGWSLRWVNCGEREQAESSGFGNAAPRRWPPHPADPAIQTNKQQWMSSIRSFASVIRHLHKTPQSKCAANCGICSGITGVWVLGAVTQAIYMVILLGRWIHGIYPLRFHPHRTSGKLNIDTITEALPQLRSGGAATGAVGRWGGLSNTGMFSEQEWVQSISPVAWGTLPDEDPLDELSSDESSNEGDAPLLPLLIRLLEVLTYTGSCWMSGQQVPQKEGKQGGDTSDSDKEALPEQREHQPSASYMNRNKPNPTCKE
ncbi:hypothetical protein BD779DRAFT_1476046 [Infundibulicybe gibba]|nr:hypothetical protein BD779DRAFT_1476046 [Infundibulicybe gibba]